MERTSHQAVVASLLAAPKDNGAAYSATPSLDLQESIGSRRSRVLTALSALSALTVLSALSALSLLSALFDHPHSLNPHT